MSKDKETIQAQVQIPPRFSVLQRIEHIVLLTSFSVLGVTGLIQKFAMNSAADWIIKVLGGIEITRVIHRTAAITFALLGVYHIIVLLYKVFVRRVEMTMLPGLKDATDALDALRYNLFLTKEPPHLPRYTFAEKMEYWAMIWGGVIMGLTGFMLWNPLITTKILPGQFIPAAKAAHGAEAILAVLAILVWHFYNVHIKMFNKSMFTGRMTKHQMEEEHGEELERLVTGKMRPAPIPLAMRRRERIFIPIAILIALVGVGTIYWAATAETTAISTLPVTTVLPTVYVPATPTVAPAVVLPTPETVVAPIIPHPVAGQEQCDTCHGGSGIKPMPANHVGRPVESCQICHKPGPTSTSSAGSATGTTAGGAKPIPHSIEGDTYKDCTTCHGADKIKPFPANHASFTSDSCQMCHKVAASTGDATAGTSTAGGPKAIPHSIEGDAYKDCTTCHGADKIKPFPANHASFAADSCTTCHQPAVGGATSGGSQPAVSAPAIPTNHDLTNELFKACWTCHGADRLKPAPANHASFTVDSCQTCHKAAQ